MKSAKDEREQLIEIRSKSSLIPIPHHSTPAQLDPKQHRTHSQFSWNTWKQNPDRWQTNTKGGVRSDISYINYISEAKEDEERGLEEAGRAENGARGGSR